MKVAVLGAGAMGSWFGGQLAQQGHTVQLLTTNMEHRNAINANGLVLKSSTQEHRIDIEAAPPSELSKSVELLLLFTKSFQTKEAMRSVAHLLSSDSHVLSLQNGLGNKEAIAEHLPLNRVWIGVSMMPVDKISPGVVANKGNGISLFGNAAREESNPMAKRILAAFENTELSIKHIDDVHQRIWEKVAFNAGMNALAALSHGRPGTIGQLPDAIALAKNMAVEVAAVAKYESVAVDLEKVFSMIKLSCEEHGDHIPSMLQDLLSRRRTEVDAINGAVVAKAAQANVAVPLNETITTLLKLAELSHIKYQ